jgi:hypothetical protein
VDDHGVEAVEVASWGEVYAGIEVVNFMSGVFLEGLDMVLDSGVFLCVVTEEDDIHEWVLVATTTISTG